MIQYIAFKDNQPDTFEYLISIIIQSYSFNQFYCLEVKTKTCLFLYIMQQLTKIFHW